MFTGCRVLFVLPESSGDQYDRQTQRFRKTANIFPQFERQIGQRCGGGAIGEGYFADGQSQLT